MVSGLTSRQDFHSKACFKVHLMNELAPDACVPGKVLRTDIERF